MTELNLKCHFQMVRSETQYGEEFTVHEAFSTDRGELYMICPTPVYVVGESKEDIKELTAMIDKDVVQYGIIDITKVQSQFDKYAEYTTLPLEEELQGDIFDMMNEEESFVVDDNFHDANGNVLDLLQFMKKRK